MISNKGSHDGCFIAFLTIQLSDFSRYDVIMTSSFCRKTRKSNNLILLIIESQDLKDNFKKGFSHEYFQKSETSFWHGVAPKPAVNRITYSQSINAYLIWDRARSEFGPGPDLIWVRDPYRFRPSSNLIFTLRVISFSKCRDATNHTHCPKKNKEKENVKK